MMLRKKDMFKVAALLREKRASLSQLARCLPYPLGVLEKYFNNEIRAEDLLPDPGSKCIKNKQLKNKKCRLVRPAPM